MFLFCVSSSTVLEVYQFARDAAVAEAWLIAQEPYLMSTELGHTIDEVDNLIKKHEAFEKSAAAQEERFSALERLTTVSDWRRDGLSRICVLSLCLSISVTVSLPFSGVGDPFLPDSLNARRLSCMGYRVSLPCFTAHPCMEWMRHNLCLSALHCRKFCMCPSHRCP